MGHGKMNKVNRMNTMENFLRLVNLVLMIENTMLREQLREKNYGICSEELEKQYRLYYMDESGELI